MRETYEINGYYVSFQGMEEDTDEVFIGIFHKFDDEHGDNNKLYMGNIPKNLAFILKEVIKN